MGGDRDVRLSKFLSLVLRHDPQRIGLELDASGWANIDELLRQSNAHGMKCDDDDLRRVVATSSKQRFAIDDARRRIRANQGHSRAVDLELDPTVPPAQLYHGTATKSITAIRSEGISRMRRQYVQLTDNYATARTVGSRHGSPVVLFVDAEGMHRDGYVFILSENGVWLTEHVPAVYLVKGFDPPEGS